MFFSSRARVLTDFSSTTCELTDFEYAVLLAIYAHPDFEKYLCSLSLSTIFEAMHWGPIPRKHLHRDQLNDALLSLNASDLVKLDLRQTTSDFGNLDLLLTSSKPKELWVTGVTEKGVGSMITHNPAESEFSSGAYKLKGGYDFHKKKTTPLEPVLPSKAKSYNYIVRWNTPGEKFAKIGHSVTPHTRFRSFLTGSPFDLLVDAVWPSWWACNEKLLHVAFRPLHYAGEWFRYEDDLKSYVDCLGKNNEALQHVEKSNHPRIKTHQA